MSKKPRNRALFRPLFSVVAVLGALVLVGPISPADATGNGSNCVPSDAVPASFSDWSGSGAYTAWQTSNSAADPDGQSGDDNPLNLQRLGGMEQKTVTDKAASDVTVIDSPAVAGQHYSLKGSSGIGTDEIPPTPEENPGIWQANAEQEPPGHYNSTQQADNSTYVEGESGLHYASHGSSGNRDWFYYRAPVAEKSHVEHTDAVTHTEYRWAIEKRTYTPAKDAVTCDHDPGGNNGTIKVDDDGLPGCNVGHSQGGDVCDNGVGNDPHLGCQFYVEWYNYEANATSTVSFEVQSPTGGTVTAVQGTVAPATVQLDGDGPEGGSDQGFDGSELYQLQFTDDPQQNHGWHVKVTTHTTWSNGSDEKSKVFWVEGDCQTPPEQPADETVTENVKGCDLSQYGLEPGTGHRDGTREYVLVDGQWVLEDMADVTWGPYEQDTTLTDEEYQEQCGEEQPADETVTENVKGCDLSQYGLEPGTGHRDGTREYVLVDGQWVLEDMADVTWGPYVQDTTLTDDEYLAQCAEVKPDDLTRSVPMSEQSCKIGGVHTWNDVYTTPFVWDSETRTWVPGEETGPVAEDDLFTPYTAKQLKNLNCIEVEGEQGHEHHGGGKNHHAPEVKGEQAAAPAAAVPSEVEAGLAGTPADTPNGGGSSLPLWALAVGAGLFVTGAGRLRRTSRI